MEEKIDKRTKEYKESRTVKVGWVHLHSPLFFARKNFKEKIDVRADKSPNGEPLSMEYDRDDKELVIRCGKHEQFVPGTNICGYEVLETTISIPQVKTTSGVSANPSINAQVSGPHDHVFAGQGAGQTGAGKRVK